MSGHEEAQAVEDDVRATIYIEVPIEATAAEADALMDVISAAAHDFERASWDPLVYAHIYHGQSG